MLRGHEIEDAILSASEQDASRLERPCNRSLARSLWWLACCIILIFVSRVFYLSIIRGEHYSAIAQGNSVRSLPLLAPRGKIYDASGTLLATNIPALSVVITKEDFFGDDRDVSQAIDQIVAFFALEKVFVEDQVALLREGGKSKVVLKEQITQKEAIAFSEREGQFPGVTLETIPQRRYESSAIFAHVVGYQSRVVREDLESDSSYLFIDMVGRSGLEKVYEQILRGKHGAKRIETNARGKIQRNIAQENPIPGSDLHLSIDAELQKKIYDALYDELQKSKLTRGAAIAMNPHTGEVLALVSLPSYDNNMFLGRIDPDTYRLLFQNDDKPLFNRALSGVYPPGSTIKPIMAYAALKEGIVSQATSIESTGSISIGEYTFRDWKAHGFADVRRAIAVSHDIFFYAIGGGYGDVRGLGIDIMKKYNEMFGLNQKTGVDLPGEASGFIPDAKWKEDVLGEKWYVGNSYHAAIGQGYIQTTPMQMAVATSIIANGGKYITPHVVDYIAHPDGSSQEVGGDVKAGNFDQGILQIVREGMRMTVTEGTATALNNLPVAIAGKTGTAQYGNEGKAHGWFEAYAPYENPEIVLVILVEGQEEKGHHAVPVTKEVLQWYFTEGAGAHKEVSSGN